MMEFCQQKYGTYFENELGNGQIEILQKINKEEIDQFIKEKKAWIKDK